MTTKWEILGGQKGLRSGCTRQLWGPEWQKVGRCGPHDPTAFALVEMRHKLSLGLSLTVPKIPTFLFLTQVKKSKHTSCASLQQPYLSCMTTCTPTCTKPSSIQSVHITANVIP